MITSTYYNWYCNDQTYLAAEGSLDKTISGLLGVSALC